MYSFFVLGLVPGTSIQITFRMWFDVVSALIFITLGCRLLLTQHRGHRPTEADDTSRLPLHASQLHLRLS